MMNLNILVLCFCSLTVFVSSTTVDPFKGTGHPNVSIVGGTPAKAGEFPYLTRLKIKVSATEEATCGGTLIGPHHILTAAHCVAPTGTILYLNTLSINGGGPGSLTRSVKKFIHHEKYSAKAKPYDIAILVLNASVTTIPVVKLPSKSDIHLSYADKSAVIAGWGTTAFKGDPSPVLLKAAVTVSDNFICSFRYPNGIFVSSTMLCADGNGKDSCQGDSGGPIIVDGVQVGITSFGKGCAVIPGIYTRITAFLDWISSTMTKNPN